MGGAGQGHAWKSWLVLDVSRVGLHIFIIFLSLILPISFFDLSVHCDVSPHIVFSDPSVSICLSLGLLSFCVYCRYVDERYVAWRPKEGEEKDGAKEAGVDEKSVDVDIVDADKGNEREDEQELSTQREKEREEEREREREENREMRLRRKFIQWRITNIPEVNMSSSPSSKQGRRFRYDTYRVLPRENTHSIFGFSINHCYEARINI